VKWAPHDMAPVKYGHYSRNTAGDCVSPRQSP
jgi:hypothetical protein